MREITVELHEEAIVEARAIREWYAARTPAAADAFMAELDQAREQIAEFPDAWAPYMADTRRYLMRRFPFFVVYRRQKRKIEVIAVAHSHRRPGYWKVRIRQG